MYSLVVKETIEYYNANRSTVYCTMLDATKAFGRVQYCKLFRKLMDRKLRCYSQIFLLSMYTAHRMHVILGGSQFRMVLSRAAYLVPFYFVLIWMVC